MSEYEMKELIEQLQDRNRHLQGMFNSQNKLAKMYYETINDRDLEIQKLLDCLKWYADRMIDGESYEFAEYMRHVIENTTKKRQEIRK